MAVNRFVQFQRATEEKLSVAELMRGIFSKFIRS
jgi:hypothetical protein